jgi:hypothetical protein
MRRLEAITVVTGIHELLKSAGGRVEAEENDTIDLPAAISTAMNLDFSLGSWSFVLAGRSSGS